VALLLLAAISETYSLVYRWNELRIIESVTLHRDGVEQGEVSLPFTLTDVEQGEQVSIVTKVKTETSDSLLIKTEGASMRLFVDSILFDSDGESGTYPEFQKGPSPNLSTVNLPAEAGFKEIRVVYTIPEAMHNLVIPPIYLGDHNALFKHLLLADGFDLALGFLLAVGGFTAALIALMIRHRLPLARVLQWLALACATTGLWGIGTNDLAIYLVPVPNLLYAGGSIGLLCISPAFFTFVLEVIAPFNRIPLVVACWVMRAIALVALILHLTGVVPLFISVQYLHFVPSGSILFFSAYVLYEYFAHRGIGAKSYVLPCAILTVFALATIVNYIVPFVRPEQFLLQVGILIFTVWAGIIGWFYVREVFDEAEKSTQLELEIESMNRNLEMQRYLYNNLTTATEQVRVVRHDLRHQLSAIRGYLEKGNVTGALGYVDTISGTIPEIANKLLCDNFAVNAVAVHYLDEAKKSAIQTDLRLVVPSDLGQIPDNDMSIIVGNLFENAIEACQYVEEDKRFIRITSKVVKNRLTLAIDNSFDGQYKETNGQFVSRKRKGQSKGIGISSVRAIVEKYGGSLKHEAADGVFMTSLYVKL
jgi:signal transduction histidine kinase